MTPPTERKPFVAFSASVFFVGFFFAAAATVFFPFLTPTAARLSAAVSFFATLPAAMPPADLPVFSLAVFVFFSEKSFPESVPALLSRVSFFARGFANAIAERGTSSIAPSPISAATLFVFRVFVLGVFVVAVAAACVSPPADRGLSTNRTRAPGAADTTDATGADDAT